MAERYDVVLDGQLGERRGTLTWTETDGRLTGTFTLFGIDNLVIGRRPSPPAAAASASAEKNRRKGQRDDLSAKSRLSGALSAEGLL